jgi:hypothetical protein
MPVPGQATTDTTTSTASTAAASARVDTKTSPSASPTAPTTGAAGASESKPASETSPTPTPSLPGEDATDDATRAFYAKLTPEDRKVLNRVFTQDRQKLADERRQFENERGFIEAFKRDPAAVIKQVAVQHGLTVADAKQAAATDKPTDELAALKNRLTELVGEEGADALIPLLDRIVDTRTAPLREAQEKATQAVLVQEAQAALAAFGQKFPDYTKYEAKMAELSGKVQLGEGMSDEEYLTALYYLAAREEIIASEAEKIASARLAKMAEGSGAASGGTKPGVPASKVTATAPSVHPTFAEAAAAAQRGERWAE